jgi:bacterioferritin (cytochrome b1)
MSQPVNVSQVSQIYNTFYHLVRELEAFVEVDDLKIAFDSHQNVYLLGQDFQEQLHADFAAHREVREELRNLIAKHRSRKS